MQLYKGYFIDGEARYPIRPTRGGIQPGTCQSLGALGSVIVVTRFELPSFKVSMKELAEWFGLELSKLVG